MNEPLYYHGFGVAVLRLETFTKVSKNNYDEKIDHEIFMNWYLLVHQNCVYLLHDVQDLNIEVNGIRENK